MNILFLGERDLSQNAQAILKEGTTDKFKFPLIKWKDLIDPVRCEEELVEVDGVIHTGVCNYGSQDIPYESTLMPFEEIINHCGHQDIPLIYISDVASKNKSPADQSYAYLHHLAERQVFRLLSEGAKGWIIRPSIIVEDLANLDLKMSEELDSVYVLSQVDILNYCLSLFEKAPESILHTLAGTLIPASILKGKLENRIRKKRNLTDVIFSRKKEFDWAPYKKIHSKEAVNDFSYYPLEKVFHELS